MDDKLTVRGRPTTFRESYVEQVYRLALLGLKDTEIAQYFDISEGNLNVWKKKYPDFYESLREGRLEADGKVAKALYDRARGYEYEEEKIESDKNGNKKKVVVKKHLPPDPASMVIWLKNRQMRYWRDKQEVEHKNSIDVNVNFQLPRPQRQIEPPKTVVTEVIQEQEEEVIEAEVIEKQSSNTKSVAELEEEYRRLMLGE